MRVPAGCGASDRLLVRPVDETGLFRTSVVTDRRSGAPGFAGAVCVAAITRSLLHQLTTIRCRLFTWHARHLARVVPEAPNGVDVASAVEA